MSRLRTICIALLLSAALYSFDKKTDGEWPVYGHDPGGQRFSPLTDINRENVKTLKVAWTFRTGDAYQPAHEKPTAFEATPLYVDGVLYIGTPLGRIIAIDPVTGKESWSYDPKIDKDAGYGDYANRGVSTWKSPTGKERRIFIGTIDARLIAVNANTGKPCTGFGDNGVINLRNGLRIAPRELSAYEETSPPAIVGSTIVVGSGIADNGSVNQPSGEVRGFDVVTGKLKWTWDPIPQDPHEVGADTWKNGSAARTGAANAWSVIVSDPQRNLIFVPTGSASPDYYGGERVGDNLFANSVVALRADTGKRVWHFQTVHHDLWDYDVASPPVLFDVHQDGRTIAAVGVGSKTGNFFILDRETGKPIFGVEERAVPRSDVPGEVSSPTQPFPTTTPALSPQRFGVEDAWGPDEETRNACKEEIAKSRAEGIFTPPSVRGSLLVPGNIGGMAWGGAAYDPAHHLLVIPVNNMVAQVRLIPRAEFDRQRKSSGREVGGKWEFAEQRGTPFGMARRMFLGPKGLPCNAPPWGMLKGVDGDTGLVKWQVPWGHLPKFGALTTEPPRALGSIGLGGPIVTAGGLVFIAGSLDPGIHAHDVMSGEELWVGDLPTSARSTPMTFRGPDGKQYVVVSAGGHDIAGGPALGDYVVAFTLP